MARIRQTDGEEKSIKAGGPPPRRGAILVQVAVLMPVLIGMLGLVVDLGLLMAARRQVQTAADAAALAAAMDRVRGRSNTDALATANAFVAQHSAFATPVSLVMGTTFNVPPASGPYAGDGRFVEVIATQEVQTLFIQVLGVSSLHNVQARAVAGYQAVAAGEGCIVLDPTAKPGLRTSSNNASIRVNGRVTVNSEGGGVDELGVQLDRTDWAQTAASAGTLGIYATDLSIVGGVNNLANFHPYNPGDPYPVHCRQTPEPDPLINLETPTVSTGVDASLRGTVKVTNNSVTLSDASTLARNFKAVGGETLGGLYTATAGQAILYPGIYQDINIEGGSVVFMPGIYVISPVGQADGFKVTGGTVTGKGIMIYSTGSNYSATNGTPDINDRDDKLPVETGVKFGSVSINASIQFTPINTKLYSYGALYSGAASVSEKFDGMLFYQRRRNATTAMITGNSAQGGLTGTLYAKWAKFDITGQGTYDAQFICGSLDVTGQGTVTIQAGGRQRGRANQVFLVE